MLYTYRTTCGLVGMLLIHLQAHTIATCSKTSVMLLICPQTAVLKLCVLKHMCTCMITQNSTSALTGDTKNKPAWLHTLILAQRATVSFHEKQMGSINTPAPTPHARTDALMHTHPQLSHKQIPLMQTQRPAVYTQKKQL